MMENVFKIDVKGMKGEHGYIKLKLKGQFSSQLSVKQYVLKSGLIQSYNGEILNITMINL